MLLLCKTLATAVKEFLHSLSICLRSSELAVPKHYFVVFGDSHLLPREHHKPRNGCFLRARLCLIKL